MFWGTGYRTHCLRKKRLTNMKKALKCLSMIMVTPGDFHIITLVEILITKAKVRGYFYIHKKAYLYHLFLVDLFDDRVFYCFVLI